MELWVSEVIGAPVRAAPQHVQSLWGGYGQIVRVPLADANVPSVIVKHVEPGTGAGLGHARKLRSYDVELAFYRHYAVRSPSRVATAHAVERTPAGWRFLLEDLDAAGFSARRHSLDRGEALLCLEWLARFHAAFLNVAPAGLWEEGTYWHLETRPDELAAIPDRALRDTAVDLDERLRRARFRTLVHGDAKPANFCFTPDGHEVAAVDFQYVGGGCGMRDVAYLLFGRRGWGSGDEGSSALLDHYFATLRDALPDEVDPDALESEWRSLHPVARADFHRFLAGWSPSARSLRDYRAALASIR